MTEGRVGQCKKSTRCDRIHRSIFQVFFAAGRSMGLTQGKSRRRGRACLGSQGISGPWENIFFLGGGTLFI